MSTLHGTSPGVTDHVILGRDGEIIGFTGMFLGFASSQRDVHDHAAHRTADGDSIPFALVGSRCSACRWFEVRIYGVRHELILTPDVTSVDDVTTDNSTRVERRGCYLVLTSGVSAVPGETVMRRTTWTDSPYEVVEVLTQRRGARPFLPTPSARALSQAAAWDSGIRDAYVDRAVI